MNGDLELNVDWQNWGAERAGNYRVIVDAQVTTPSMPDNGIDLKENIVGHGLEDTFGVRLGGSWNFPAGANTVIARGGVGYETGAAKDGWERADFDGAARMLATVGGSFRMSRVQIDAGFGYIHQGTRTDSRTCNPILDAPPYEGCGPPCEDSSMMRWACAIMSRVSRNGIARRTCSRLIHVRSRPSADSPSPTKLIR